MNAKTAVIPYYFDRHVHAGSVDWSDMWLEAVRKKNEEAIIIARVVRLPHDSMTSDENWLNLVKLIAAAPDLAAALNKIHNWLVCAAIASPADMAKSFPKMEKVARNAIDKLEITLASYDLANNLGRP